MELSNYSDLIELNNRFRPYLDDTGADAMEAAIRAAQNDPKLQRYAGHLATEPEKRRWLQAALTVREPGELGQDLLAATDYLLQSELAAKQVTDAAALPRLQGSYPAAHRVSIWNGDISTLKVGAIVNAANNQLLGCFQPFHACIDNVIHCAAGPRLREDCHAIMRLQGHREPTGNAKITRAYNLPADFVLHTVGPIISRGDNPTAQQAGQLARCYESCLNLAAEAGVRSVAFCGISTGVFGYPAEQAAGVALKTVADWLGRTNTSVDHVIFNTYGDSATQIYKDAIREWPANDSN